MTTVTLRPDGTVANGKSVTGAASAHAALADESDATYVTVGYRTVDADVLSVDLGTFTLPAGAVTRDARVSWRENAAAVGVADTVAELQANGIRLIAASGRPDNSGFRDSASATTPVTWDQDTIDGLRFAYASNSSTLDMQISRMALTVTYVTKPVVTVTPVSPDPYTASTTVPVAWTRTYDVSGGVPDRYRVKVFADHVYGSAGFDPQTSKPIYNSHLVLSSDMTHTVGPIPTGDTYRVYVQTAVRVNGSPVWSDWAYDEFTMDVTTSEVDTVTAVPQDTSGRINVTVTRDTATAAWEFIEVQRSTDAATTWVDVRGATYVDCTADVNTFAVHDYEVANGRNVLYRARATYLSSGLPIASAWAESATVAWSSPDAFLVDPNCPARNLAVCVTRLPTEVRPRQQGVFQVIGRQIPVVVSDVAGARTGTLTLTTRLTDTSPLDLLSQPVLLFQPPPDYYFDSIYMAPGKISHQRGVRIETRDQWSVEYVEVDAPTDPTAGR